MTVQEKMQAEQLTKDLKAAMDMARDMLTPDLFEESKMYRYVMDDKDRDAAIVFRLVLRAVKDVFGESITPEVVCKAIEAGSYLGYRSIMGETQGSARRY